jgi:hypothetical protein
MLPVLLLAAMGAASERAVAQLDGSAWQADARALPEAQRAHLWRVGAWGAANVVLGASLLAASCRGDQPARHGFGVQSAAWGAINVGIAAVGLSGGLGDPAASLADAIRAENGYADVLLLNLGLNVGYAGVGAALVAVGHRAGIESPSTRGALRGHGWALVLQGAGLLVLDGIAWLDGRVRLGRLLDGVEAVALAPGVDRIGLVVLF